MILRLASLVLAIAAAAGALWLYSPVLMIAAVLLGALAFVGRDWTSIAACAGRRWRCHWRTIDRSGVGGICAIGAFLLSTLTVALTWHDRYSSIGVALWALVIGLLVVGAARLDRLDLGSLARKARLLASPSVRPEVASVVAITLVGLGLRVYDLNGFPPPFHGDEGEMGLLALQIMNGQRFPVFTTSPFWGLSYLFNYLQAGSMLVFGDTVPGIRMLSVLVGTACIPVVYGLARVSWGPLAAATAAWLLAVSHLHIHYSRMATIFIESVLAMAVMMLLFTILAKGRASNHPSVGVGQNAADERAPESGAWTMVVVAGIVAGLSQYFYFASRVVPIVAAPLLLVLWRRHRISLTQVAAFVFSAVVVYAPLGSHYVHRPDYFFGRLQTVSVFGPEHVRAIVGQEATLPAALPSLLAEQLRRVLSLFVQSGDYGGFYSSDVSAFDVVTAAMLWLGMGAALARPGRFPELCCSSGSGSGSSSAGC